MREQTRVLAVEALRAMRERWESCVRSVAFDIGHKQSVCSRSTSPGAKTRATNELAVLKTALEAAKVGLANTVAALADLEAM